MQWRVHPGDRTWEQRWRAAAAGEAGPGAGVAGDGRAAGDGRPGVGVASAGGGRAVGRARVRERRAGGGRRRRPKWRPVGLSFIILKICGLAGYLSTRQR